ncbi:O-methyltransferase [Streptomyces monticola]|uniref:O-methyltransferase n=1 Tax=Streptomyces monticola TaxID=2666263 RepID=A0ABW2JGZ3_9ACTN
MTISPDTKTVAVTPQIHTYVQTQLEAPSRAQHWLIEQTHALGPSAVMQIPREQGVLLTMLVALAGARRIVEVGTYTGYSTLCLAQGLPAEGTVITCDLSEEWTRIAREAWDMAEVSDRVDLRLGPASQTLAALPTEPHIDLVFIDADKKEYVDYWEQLVPRVRPGGLLIADNVLYGGDAADPDADSDGSGNAAAIRVFNEHVRSDRRVTNVLLPVADGLTLARKLP